MIQKRQDQICVFDKCVTLVRLLNQNNRPYHHDFGENADVHHPHRRVRWMNTILHITMMVNRIGISLHHHLFLTLVANAKFLSSILKTLFVAFPGG
jgi:hypothetical protein